MRTFVDSIQSDIKNWWLSLVLGILFVIGGIWLIITPTASYVALSMLFAIFMFVSGLFEIIFAATNRNAISSWGWYLASGIIDLIIGIMLVSIPGLSMAVLPFIVAFWLIFRGFSGVGVSMDMRRYGITGWGWTMALSILAILFAIGIIWVPAVGAFTFVFVVAYALLLLGIFRIYLAFKLRDLHKKQKAIAEHIEEL